MAGFRKAATFFGVLLLATTAIWSPVRAESAQLALADLAGEKRTLDDWRGKVLVVNFWATWCPTCQYETPDLIHYQRRYGKEGLQVLGIGIDDARKLRNFVRTFGINYPVLVAEPTRSRRLLASWGNRRGVVPYTVVVGPDGRVVHTRHGEFTPEAFERHVLPLLHTRLSAAQ